MIYGIKTVLMIGVLMFACFPFPVLGSAAVAQAQTESTVYVCPMDADVKSEKPGKCPRCGMTLKSSAAQADPAARADVRVPMPEAGKGATTNERQVERQVSKNSKWNQAAAAYFTNTVLLTQDNKPVRFYDDLLKDKVVLINFIFTSCKGVCSPMTANLLKVQSYLGDRAAGNINMITISVDPTVDTPDVLKKYASSFKVKPGWHFLTGDKESIDLVLNKLGALVKNRDEHSTVLLVGNMKTGEWTKIHAMLKPAQIADTVINMTLPSAGE